MGKKEEEQMDTENKVGQEEDGIGGREGGRGK